MWQSPRWALSIPSDVMLSAARAVERSCAHQCRHLSLVWPDRPTMGATMAKPRTRPRPLTLEVRFETARGSWEILGRAYQRLLPRLVRSTSSKPQEPGNEGRHESSVPESRSSTRATAGGDLRPCLFRPSGRAPHR